MERRGWPLWRWIGLAGVLLLAAVPYLYAASSGGRELVFGGFLLNPLDGNSYLAKMYQGWQGAWCFRLTYSPERSSCAYLFLFYLFLGHLARWSGLSLLVVFHAARLLSAAWMILALAHFLRQALPEARLARLAFFLAAFGSGLGWLALAFSGLSGDFWVAEAYPFLSAYANPHFPLSLALLLGLLLPVGGDAGGEKVGWSLLAAFILALLSPFGLILALAVLGLLALDGLRGGLENSGRPIGQRDWPNRLKRAPYLNRFMAVLAGGALPLLYDFWVVRADPVLAGWNAQNLTSSLAPGDLLVSFSPALILALPGAWSVWKGQAPAGKVLLAWALSGLALAYLPFGLQRRMLAGWYIPLAGLSVLGLEALARRGKPGAGPERRLRLGGLLLFLLAIPTNLILLLGAWGAVRTGDGSLYLQRSERQALAWIEANTPPEALILAAPQTGQFVPAYTGRRVLYGHPFESLTASERKLILERFFATGAPDMDLLQGLQVDYVFAGPRERALGGWVQAGVAPGELTRVYQAGDVIIYAARSLAWSLP